MKVRRRYLKPTDATLNVAALARRVERLERENRRLRRAGAGGALLLALVVLSGAAKTPVAVDARMLRIVDANGKIAATFDTDGLLFHDANGKVRAALRGDGLSFHEPNESVRCVLAGDGLSFHDTNQTLRATLNGNRVSFYDGGLKTLAGLMVNENGAGSLLLSTAPGTGWRLLPSGAGLDLADATDKVLWSTAPR